jgi:hypothetical protein
MKIRMPQYTGLNLALLFVVIDTLIVTLRTLA